MDIIRIPRVAGSWVVGFVKLETRLILSVWPQFVLLIGIAIGVGAAWERIDMLLGSPSWFWYMVGYIGFAIVFTKISEWMESTQLHQRVTLDEEEIFQTGRAGTEEN